MLLVGLVPRACEKFSFHDRSLYVTVPSKGRIYGLVTKGGSSESILTGRIYASVMENLNTECSEVLVNKREYFQGNMERDH